MTHSASVTSGILSLMHLCPKEAAHLRKELLIAARHIFATDLRQSKIYLITFFVLTLHKYCLFKNLYRRSNDFSMKIY